MRLEQRNFLGEATLSGRTLYGHAALWNSPAKIDGFTEVIRHGAFTDSLQTRDVLCLVDHKMDSLLARTGSGTLRLEEDREGLFYELSVPDTQLGHDVIELCKRGDLGGMSFGFLIPEGGEIWIGERRELVKVDLFEISIVSAWPAYEGTTVNVRGLKEPQKTPSITMAMRWLETCRGF